MNHQYVNKVIDLTNPEKNVIYNMTNEEAVSIVRSGDVEAVRKIDGQFSLVSVEGKTIRDGKIYRTTYPLFHCKTS